MRQVLKKSVFAVCALAVIGAQGVSGQQTFDNWAIAPGQDGKSVTMTYANPGTYLKIESDLVLLVDAVGAAASGTIHFKDGVQRAMTPGEVAFYFTEYNAGGAYWDFREKQGTLTTFDFSSAAIPQGFTGQLVRAVSKAGKQYIGVMSLLPASPDWFSLNIRGNTMLFYKNAVKEIQVLK